MKEAAKMVPSHRLTKRARLTRMLAIDHAHVTPMQIGGRVANRNELQKQMTAKFFFNVDILLLTN